MREVEPAAGQHLQAADLVAAAATVVGFVEDRDSAPVQGLDLQVEAGLVAFDHPDVGGILTGEKLGMAALDVHRVGGVGEIESGQQRRERGDLTRKCTPATSAAAAA